MKIRRPRQPLTSYEYEESMGHGIREAEVYHPIFGPIIPKLPNTPEVLFMKSLGSIVLQGLCFSFFVIFSVFVITNLREAFSGEYFYGNIFFNSLIIYGIFYIAAMFLSWTTNLFYHKSQRPGHGPHSSNAASPNIEHCSPNFLEKDPYFRTDYNMLRDGDIQLVREVQQLRRDIKTINDWEESKDSAAKDQVKQPVEVKVRTGGGRRRSIEMTPEMLDKNYKNQYKMLDLKSVSAPDDVYYGPLNKCFCCRENKKQGDTGGFLHDPNCNCFKDIYHEHLRSNLAAEQNSQVTKYVLQHQFKQHLDKREEKKKLKVEQRNKRSVKFAT